MFRIQLFLFVFFVTVHQVGILLCMWLATGALHKQIRITSFGNTLQLSQKFIVWSLIWYCCLPIHMNFFELYHSYCFQIKFVILIKVHLLAVELTIYNCICILWRQRWLKVVHDDCVFDHWCHEHSRYDLKDLEEVILGFKNLELLSIMIFSHTCLVVSSADRSCRTAFVLMCVPL
jgi:hypothetical protein